MRGAGFASRAHGYLDTVCFKPSGTFAEHSILSIPSIPSKNNYSIFLTVSVMTHTRTAIISRTETIIMRRRLMKNGLRVPVP